jgi:hypothetical protein
MALSEPEAWTPETNGRAREPCHLQYHHWVQQAWLSTQINKTLPFCWVSLSSTTTIDAESAAKLEHRNIVFSSAPSTICFEDNTFYHLLLHRWSDARQTVLTRLDQPYLANLSSWIRRVQTLQSSLIKIVLGNVLTKYPFRTNQFALEMPRPNEPPCKDQVCSPKEHQSKRCIGFT